MKKTEIVNRFIAAIEADKINIARSLLTDDFIFTGPVPRPIGPDEYMDLHRKLNQGLDNFSFNIRDLNESGNIVNGTVQVSGTHSKEMPALLKGMKSIPATHKKVSIPKEDIAVSFKGDKISKITVERVPNGGIPGMLKQLGVTVPENV